MKITSAEFITSAPDYDFCPEESLPEFAFIGRSNVGKSSLINMLVGRKGLAKVSATPGATQMLNFFNVNHDWLLVDLPGYGYSKTPQKLREQFQKTVSDYLNQRSILSCVFVLIDSRHTPQKIDLDFCDWLAQGGIPFVLTFTKADKVKKAKLNSNVEAFLKAFAERVDGEPRYFITSAENGQGKDQILDFIDLAIKGG